MYRVLTSNGKEVYVVCYMINQYAYYYLLTSLQLNPLLWDYLTIYYGLKREAICHEGSISYKSNTLYNLNVVLKRKLDLKGVYLKEDQFCLNGVI